MNYTYQDTKLSQKIILTCTVKCDLCEASVSYGCGKGMFIATIKGDGWQMIRDPRARLYQCCLMCPSCVRLVLLCKQAACYSMCLKCGKINPDWKHDEACLTPSSP